jgi:hypothetical protein
MITHCDYKPLVSISPTFYELFLHQNPFTKKLQTQILSTQKLHKNLLYEKAARKILVKLIPACLGQHGTNRNAPICVHHQGLQTQVDH